MLGKITSRMLGLSHLGKFIPDDKLAKTYANGYILEDEERIFYLIKTKTDEYCFTNSAFIHIDSTDKRNILKRYDYNTYLIDEISLEVAGDMDLDAELKFRLLNISDYKEEKKEKHQPLKRGLPNYKEGIAFSISIHRNEIEYLKALYRTLVKIGKLQVENIEGWDTSKKTLEMAFNTFLTSNKTKTTSEEFEEITLFADRWMLDKKHEYSNDDFLEVFETYLVVSDVAMDNNNEFPE